MVYLRAITFTAWEPPVKKYFSVVSETTVRQNSGAPEQRLITIPRMLMQAWKAVWITRPSSDHTAPLWSLISTLLWLMQSNMYICFNANQPGINAMWPSVYMHSGNLELCNVTSIINAFQHHVKCHFDITTEYLLKYWAIYNKKLTWNPNEYLQLLHSFP